MTKLVGAERSNALNKCWTSGAFVLAATLGFAHVLFRACSIPLVHDECTSFLAYAQSGRFLPFMSMWDANNHYFNSLLGIVGYKLFGLHLLALRWGSVLAYLLYAWSAYRVGANVRHAVVRWCLWSALLMCPFLLDFFSLFRGYGPAMAFLLFALQATLRFAQQGERRQLVHALLGMAIANGFLLALVPLWGLQLALLLIAGAMQKEHIRVWVLLGALPLLGAAALAFFMAHMGLLYQGSTTGFVAVTAVTLLWRTFGSQDVLLATGTVIFVLAACVAAFCSAWRQRSWRSPAFIVALLLMGESMARILAANTIGLNYGEDRTALHTLLLAIIAVAFAADALLVRVRYAWMFALPLLAFPLRSALDLNLDHTVLWPEQSIPDRFVLFVKAMQERSARPLVVGTHRHAGLPWSLQCRMLGWESDANAHDWPNGAHDVRITDARYPHADMNGYVVVDSLPGAGLPLLVRTPRVSTSVVLDTMIGLPADTVILMDSLSFGVPDLRTKDLLVELEGMISVMNGGPDARMRFTVFDTLGTPVHEDLIFLSTRHGSWNGEHFRTIRYVPHHPMARRIVIELQDPREADRWIDHGHVVVRAIEQ